MSMESSKAAILVVEDELAIQQGLCDVLAFHGYQPTGVGTGEEGLRCGRSGQYELVILDIMLPGVNGFDVCEQLRAELPRLPILMLTALGAEDDVLRGFRSGSDDYVTKPFSISELLARVEALLRRSGKLERPCEEVFQMGDWQIDAAERVARLGESSIRTHAPGGGDAGALRAGEGSDRQPADSARRGLGLRHTRTDRDPNRRHAHRQAAQEARRGAGADRDGPRRGLQVLGMRFP